jgi:hypothetical protein
MKKLGLRIEPLRSYIYRATDPALREQLAGRMSGASEETLSFMDIIVVGAPFADGVLGTGVPSDPSMYSHELIDKAVEVRYCLFCENRGAQ